MQRKLSIRFRDGGYRFDLRQRFHGAHFRGDELFVSVTGTCVGILPAVPAGQQFEIGDVESTFIHEASGRITMTSIHSYTAGGVTHVYDVTETIIFSECAQSRNAVSFAPSRRVDRPSFVYRETFDVSDKADGFRSPRAGRKRAIKRSSDGQSIVPTRPPPRRPKPTRPQASLALLVTAIKIPVRRSAAPQPGRCYQSGEKFVPDCFSSIERKRLEKKLSRPL